MRNHLKSARIFAELMDNKFQILGFKFGIDPLIGLIPQGGNLVTLILSTYMMWIAVKMKVPKRKIARMYFNTFVDFTVGIIPVLGQIADFVIKSNEKNLEILEEHERGAYVEEPIEIINE